jgi:protein-S-isoprenylcysteine O-methyltransferase Ste14
MARKIINVTLFAKGLPVLLIVVAIMLLIAGKMSYWQVWFFGLVNLFFLAFVSALFLENNNLFGQRLRPVPGAKWWDRVLWMFYGPANMAIIVVASLDAGRFGWTSNYPLAVYFLGYLGYFCGGALHLWSIRTNPFYVSTVSIRDDRSQAVIDQGPYRLMRHPGYTGIILMVNSIAIVLGSLWALIPSVLTSMLLVVRTLLEDRALQLELSGYQEYAGRVRYRLLPGVW